MPNFWFWRRRRPKKVGVETIRQGLGKGNYAVVAFLVIGGAVQLQGARHEMEKAVAIARYYAQVAHSSEAPAVIAVERIGRTLFR